MTPLISHARLLALFRYDAETGVFTRLAPTNRHAAGPINTVGNRQGYLRLYIDGRRYQQHRLAFFYVNGRWPGAIVDHKHGDKAANAIDQIREADKVVNGQNRKTANSNNRLGLMGVCPKVRKDGSTVYKAQIRADGRVQHLGTFSLPTEAHNAYLNAKRRLHPGYIPAPSAIVKHVQGRA
jgi:hypothetical protein